MPIRVTGFIKRRPDMTHEEFRVYWSEHHAKIFNSLEVVKKNIVRYNQFHVLEQPSEVLAKAGMKIAPYDGAGEFHVDKIEDLLLLFQDEAFRTELIPDEANFLDGHKIEIMVGEDLVKYQRE